LPRHKINPTSREHDNNIPYNVAIPMDDGDRKLLLSWLLRLVGSTELLAFIAVIMPRSWMEASHLWLGLGVMPQGAVLMFLIRQASYTYGIHGISLWLIASDVKRFRPLILLNAISFLLAGPIFFIIDYTAGTPMWWTLGDGPSCGLFGLAMLWLCRKE
jgi:hypothetical protein